MQPWKWREKAMLKWMPSGRSVLLWITCSAWLNMNAMHKNIWGEKCSLLRLCFAVWLRWLWDGQRGQKGLLKGAWCKLRNRTLCNKHKPDLFTWFSIASRSSSSVFGADEVWNIGSKPETWEQWELESRNSFEMSLRRKAPGRRWRKANK